jgi:hypothetical protein
MLNHDKPMQMLAPAHAKESKRPWQTCLLVGRLAPALALLLTLRMYCCSSLCRCSSLRDTTYSLLSTGICFFAAAARLLRHILTRPVPGFILGSPPFPHCRPVAAPACIAPGRAEDGAEPTQQLCIDA